MRRAKAFDLRSAIRERVLWLSKKFSLYFLAFVVAMDFFVVAMLINRSFEMFASLLGTWLLFALIFTSTYLTGRYVASSIEKATS